MVPLDVNFLFMERDEQVVWNIDARVAELEKHCDSIIGCRVLVIGPQPDKSEAGLFEVRITLALPCREITVDHGNNTDTDVYTAIQKAFTIVGEQAQIWLGERRKRQHYRASRYTRNPAKPMNREFAT